jgi:hypothetical protein
MDTSVSLPTNASLIAGWITAIGSHPKSVTNPGTAWEFHFDYPANAQHTMIVANPSAQPRALLVGTKVGLSNEHLTAFALREDADKIRFIRDLQNALNREFVEFAFEGQQGPLACPLAFQVTATRYDDCLSLDGFARAVSSVYKAEFAGIMVVQDHLGASPSSGSGGDFPFRVRMQ